MNYKLDLVLIKPGWLSAEEEILTNQSFDERL